MACAPPIWKNAVDTGDVGGREDGRVGADAVARGRREDYFVHAGDAGRDGGHEHSRGVGRLPTGRIDAGAGHGRELLA